VKKLLLTALASLGLMVPLLAADLPRPPPGFTWQQISELKAALLKPDGRFFKHEEQKGTLVYFITKESIVQGGDFSTGLTVNVFRGLKEPAVEHGRALIEQIASQTHGDKWARTFGPFQEFSCNARDSESVMRYLAVANPKTNTLYLFIFESPVSDWDSAWKLGKEIMDNLAIDDDI
jgi:hypothetical protein